MVLSGGQGLQEPGTRLKILVAKHGIKKVLAVAENPEKFDKEMTLYDATLIVAWAKALQGSGENLERLLNRMFGKVPDKQINLNLNLDVEAEQLSNRARDLLNDLGAQDDIELETDTDENALIEQ